MTTTMHQHTTSRTRLRRGLLALLVGLAGTFVAVGPAAAGDDEKGTDRAHKEVAGEAAVDDSPDRGARPRAKAQPGAEKALAAIQRRIERHVAEQGTKHSFASYVDGDTGRIVIETDAPQSLVDDLTKVSGDDQRQAVEHAKVRRTTTTDSWHRRDDIQSYWGGGGIRVGNGLCSSGYAVKSSSGYRYSVTAGHCFADWSSVQTESQNNDYGIVLGRRLPTVTGHAKDMELVYGKSYAGRIFTGGVTSTSSARVVAAGTAYQGYTNYCHSGRTTGENCGHTATSINGQVCTQTGCKSPVIVFTGGTIIQGGDSGSPFYAKDSSGGAWIRGHNIASSATTGYVQPWTTVAAEYGVSIVTG